MVSGVSGSGKSSLAFDTIYAEGQRRYVESLSAYARQFLERIEKPDVDLIDGLAPAIAIKQKNSTRNPRSTVATATEIYDYMRLLYARCGTVHCIVCDGIVKRDSVDEIAAAILALDEGTRLHAIFPVQKPTRQLCPTKPSSRRRPQSRRKGRKPAKKPPQTQNRSPHRRPQRAPGRSSPARIQPPLSGRQDLRILHARVAPRNRLLAARLRPRRPHRRLRRKPRPHRRRRRDRLSRVRRNPLSRSSPRDADPMQPPPRANASASPPPSSAKPAIASIASPSRASSPSTIPSAPARAARALATPSTSIST